MFPRLSKTSLLTWKLHFEDGNIALNLEKVLHFKRSFQIDLCFQLNNPVFKLIINKISVGILVIGKFSWKDRGIKKF